MPPRDWSPRFLESTRGRIIARLRRGDATVEELAQAVGLTDNGIRVHLATLERDGWIYARGVRRLDGPGKPPTLYRLNGGVEPLLSAAYRPLLVSLLGVLSAAEPPARMARLLQATGRHLAGTLGPLPPGPVPEQAVAVLSALGAEVELEQETAGRFTVRGFGCPVSEAVGAEPRVCHAVTALLGGLLDAQVTERCDREGSPRCRFEVVPRS